VLVVLLVATLAAAQAGMVAPRRRGDKRSFSSSSTAVAAATAPALPAPTAAAPAAAADAAGADDGAVVAAVRHPAMPAGKAPDDPRFRQLVEDMIAAFFKTLESADDSKGVGWGGVGGTPSPLLPRTRAS
jgi:hypothetical protein